MKEGVKDERTVFVRGVSFDVDDREFEAALSDIGPVKSCFLVKPQGQGGGKHRGFGFCTFAVREDAERAVEEMNGKAVKGRKLQVGADSTLIDRSRRCARLEPSPLRTQQRSTPH